MSVAPPVRPALIRLSRRSDATAVPCSGTRILENEGFSPEGRAATLVHLAELERVREMVAAALRVETGRRRGVPETGEET
jgi:hypothetical protein